MSHLPLPIREYLLARWDRVLSLQSQISQPLLRPLPPAFPCYPTSDPSGDCADVHRLWSLVASFRANESGAMQGANFETFVLTNGTLSACFNSNGSVPVVGVDIQAAVKFTAAHNLRVVVKGAGHDLSGRSTARGSFVIWTHNLKHITFHESFRPTAITPGASVQWQEAYEAVNAQDRVLVGGVGNVLQFTMISSNGTSFVANTFKNPDLFFARRGGGWGTYGVITSVTSQTHENLPLVAALFQASTKDASPTASLQSLLTELVRVHPELSYQMTAGRVVAQSFGHTGVDEQHRRRSERKHRTVLRHRADTCGEQLWRRYGHDRANCGLAHDLSLPGSYGNNGYRGRLLALAPSQPEHVSETLVPLPGLVMLVDPDTMGVNSAWRTALVHAIFSNGWAEGTPVDVINRIMDKVEANMTGVRRLLQRGFSEPHQAFFGDHHVRLREIKAIYDPIDMFVVREGICLDEWTRTSCRV
ncbi:hypothetical protein BD311DRAFT_735330 [Dichomitus squalens]|uniref:Uncharacterized protein n=1 Tax=Dichomitus squalens TaxID=114155 RepID=A0A4Q9N5I8_9APHY|nr:hypothetical protein BD311DRAFT_735330 [Dichomitus squalens]